MMYHPAVLYDFGDFVSMIAAWEPLFLTLCDSALIIVFITCSPENLKIGDRMKITVRDALSFGGLTGGQVAAGASGLENVIVVLPKGAVPDWCSATVSIS
jgi:hypothetical protein